MPDNLGLMEWFSPNFINGGLFLAFFGAIFGWATAALGRRADRKSQREQWEKMLEWEREKSQTARFEEHQRWHRDQCVQAYLEFRKLVEQFILQERSPTVFDKDVPLLSAIRNIEAALRFLMPDLKQQPEDITTKVLSFRNITDRTVLEAATAQVVRDLSGLDREVQAVLHKKG